MNIGLKEVYLHVWMLQCFRQQENDISMLGDIKCIEESPLLGTAGACSQVWLLVPMPEILHSIKAGLLLLLAGGNRFLPFPSKLKAFGSNTPLPTHQALNSCVFGHPDHGWKMLHVNKIGIIVLQYCWICTALL